VRGWAEDGTFHSVNAAMPGSCFSIR
jgi:hypothetical protein